ncbi:hypothetical protein KCU64_g51, partial [Aureobasidium melanogenum]
MCAPRGNNNKSLNSLLQTHPTLADMPCTHLAIVMTNNSTKSHSPRNWSADWCAQNGRDCCRRRWPNKSQDTSRRGCATVQKIGRRSYLSPFMTRCIFFSDPFRPKDLYLCFLLQFGRVSRRYLKDFPETSRYRTEAGRCNRSYSLD